MRLIKKQFFPETTIRNVASNDAVYMRGKALYKDHRITSISGDPNRNTVTLHVQEQEDNEVSWGFFPNGLAKRYHCSCKDFQRYSGGCQHVTAAMFALNELEAADIVVNGKGSGKVTVASQNNLLNQQAIRELFAEEEDEAALIRRNLRQTEIAIEFTLSIGRPEFFQPFSLSLRVGEEYLYVVQDARRVVEGMLKGENLPFGKRFTFDPEFHSLNEQDEKMLRILHEIDSIFESVDAVQQFSSPKEFVIPPQYMRRVLEQLVDCPNGFVVRSYKKTHETSDLKSEFPVVHPKTSKLPLTLSLEKEDEKKLLLKINEAEFQSLSFYEEAGFAEKKNEFYFLSSANMAQLKRLRQAFSVAGPQGITLEGDQANDFVSRFLPRVEKVIQVDLPLEVEQEFARRDLKVHLTIDSDGEELHAVPEFHYGDAVIRPLDTDQKSENKSGFFMRDTEKELSSLKQLQRASSEWEDEKTAWVLRGETAVGEFLYNAVPDLMDVFQIYLSPETDRLFTDSSSSPRLELEWDHRANMLDVSFQTEEMSSEDLQLMIKQLNQKKKFVKLTNGKLLNLSAPAYQDLADSARSLDLSWRDIKKNMSVPVYRGLSLGDKENIEKGKQFQKLINQLFDPASIPFKLPDSLHASLRPYQETGIKWLKTLDHYGFGGVLADDMGLGKTLQTIGYVASCLEEQPGRFMVICPSSVLFNWQREFESFAPTISTALIHGNAEERAEAVRKAKEEEVSVWITSYPLIMRDSELYEEEFFHTIILDEAQYVKNHTAKTTMAVRQLRSRTKLALSGTPIENNLGELYTMFSIVMPGLFPGRKQFKQLETREISKKVRPFILRRLKKDVLDDLPEKVETNEYIDLYQEQKKMYQTQIQMLRTDLNTLDNQKQFNENRFRILAGMTRLRQICCDPRLVLPDYSGGSSKLDRLIEFLSEALANGRRIVVFSQFTRMLSLIRKILDEKEETYFYLDGSTKSSERLELTTRFNEGENNLFLISLKAGGTGLNLTGGDTVVLYDSWWNPAIEEQAADRVHRFGQKKNVQVVRMIAQGTIEERINELQKKKKELIDSVIETGEQDLTSLTKEEILSLLE